MYIQSTGMIVDGNQVSVPGTLFDSKGLGWTHSLPDRNILVSAVRHVSL